MSPRIGDPHCSSPGSRAYAFVDERKQVYKKLVVNEDGTRLLGGILIGDADDYGAVAEHDARWYGIAVEPRRADRAELRRLRAAEAARVLPDCPRPRRSALATTSARA